MGAVHSRSGLAESSPVSSRHRLDATNRSVEPMGPVVGRRRHFSAIPSLRIFLERHVLVEWQRPVRPPRASPPRHGALCLDRLHCPARRFRADARVGWLAFWLAALYSPYYAYSWTLLRDLLGWIITAILLLLLLELDLSGANKRKTNWLMCAVGFALGLGYLARETFFLIIPLVLAALAVRVIRSRNYPAFTCLTLSACSSRFSPLLIRNAQVGAPLFFSVQTIASPRPSSRATPSASVPINF